MIGNKCKSKFTRIIG